MRDAPDAADLLAIARKMLEDELLPNLPREQRYNALMVAAAIGIAAREARNGDHALDAERADLADLLATGDDDGSLADLNRRFADALRAGGFDDAGPRRERAMRILRDSTLARLGECNPRYLDNQS